MSLINLKTADQRLEIVSAPKITSGNRNVDELSVDLDNTWNYQNLNIKARFHTESSDSYIVEMQKDGTEYKCQIPDEAEALPGILYIGIFGEADGNLIKTTNEIHLTVAPGTETTGQLVVNLLTELIDVLKRKVSSAISDDISAEDVKSIIESKLSTLQDYKVAFEQQVMFVNNYQNTDYNSADLENLSSVSRDMWDIGVQLSQLRAALSAYSSSINGEEVTLDGSVDVIIDEVGNELDSLIAAFEEQKAVFEVYQSKVNNQIDIYANLYLRRTEPYNQMTEDEWQAVLDDLHRQELDGASEVL